jgi:ATP-dependent RNA helicase DeaD
MHSNDPHAEPEASATGTPTPAPDAAEAEAAYVPSGSDYVSDRDFVDFPISPEVIRAVHDMGFRTATPVQAATIEPALAGRDLLVRAKTGTGKTAAFCIPIVERIPEGDRGPRAIVLAPTRELAQQIADDGIALTKYRDVKVAVLVGGMPMGPQERALEEGASLIIGTPGRVLDHLRRGSLSLAGARMVCLDEADEMLSMGFYEDVTKILEALPKGAQTLLFSATISPQTERLIAKYMTDPEQIRLSTDADQVEGIEHVIYETPPNQHKVRSLLYLLDMEDPTSAIIFCNTREDAATVATFLDRQGFDAQLLSGELPQSRRNKVMKQVKAGAVRFLVATDVAARGIDISDLSHVIQYSLPQDPAVYLHRTGRTGRIGKKGKAISLISGPDLGTKRVLQSQHQIAFVEKAFPTPEECTARRVERQAAQIRDAMGSLVFESYLPTARALLQRPDGDALIAAALRAFFQWDRTRRAEMASDVEAEEPVEVTVPPKAPREVQKARGEESGERRERKERGERSERGDRKERGERRDRKERGERRERGERKERGKPSNELAIDDLDALLLEADSGPEESTPLDDLDAALAVEGGEVEAKAESTETEAAAEASGEKKKRRRRRRKKKGAAATGAAGAEGAETDDAEDGDEEEVSEPAAAVPAEADLALDDLDAFLAID